MNILTLLTTILARIMVRNVFSAIIPFAKFLTFWTFDKIHCYAFSVMYLFFAHFYGSLSCNLEISLYCRRKDYVTSAIHVPKILVLCFYILFFSAFKSFSIILLTRLRVSHLRLLSDVSFLKFTKFVSHAASCFFST